MKPSGMSRLCVSMLVLLLTVVVSHGVYLEPNNWTTAITITDLNTDGFDNVSDIVGLWYAKDVTYHYFRMDMETGPAGSGVAQDYMLYLDTDQSVATGAADIFNDPLPVDPAPAGLSQYIADNPGNLWGVDQIVDAHYLGGVLNVNHFHDYSVGATAYNYTFPMLGGIPGALYQDTENLGTSLEWRVPISALDAGPFRIAGGTMIIGNLTGPFTTDYTENWLSSQDFVLDDEPGGVQSIPEPGTLALMGVLGIVGGAMKLRTRRRTES